MPNLLMLANGVGLVAATTALWVQGQQRADHRFFAGLISIAVTLSLFSVSPGRDRDRTPASYVGSCRHARSSLRATIVSTVTEAAAGRTFSLAAPDRIGVDTSRGRRAPRSAPAGTRRPAAASRPGAAAVSPAR